MTGADGFVGRHVCRALETEGHRVHRVTRKARAASNAWDVPDLATHDIPNAAFEGVDVLLHLAANMDGGADPVSMSKTQEMAGRVAAGAARHGIRRCILMSSVAVRLLDAQTTNPRPYALQKQAAEDAFRAALGRENTCIVLRPPVIYGQGAKGSFGLLVKLIERGLPLPVDNGAAKRCYLSGSNLSALIGTLVRAPDDRWAQADGMAFEPHDGAAVSTYELVRMIAKALGRRARTFSLPRSFIRMAAKATGKVDQVNAIFEPLECAEVSVLNEAFGWTPHESLPRSLVFLASEGPSDS